MNTFAHIKQMISGRKKRATAWAGRFFHGRRQSVATTVIESVSANGGGKVERLTPESRLFEDVALNELQRVQLVLDVESRFDLEIPDGDAERIKTIEELVDCVESKVPLENGTPTQTA